MAALKDIAREAGVSLGTVSRILNQGRAHLYSTETRDRVLSISQRLGYRPNRSAQAMRSRKTQVVGFASLNLTEDGYLQNYGVHPFTLGLSHELAQSGYHMALVECSDLGDPQQPARPWSVQEQFFDGLVVHYGFSDRAVRFAEDMGLPLIWWDSGVFEPQGCIYRDEGEVGRQVTRQLIKLGHTRIGYTAGQRGWQAYSAGEPQHFSYTHRFEGYRDEMRARGLRETPLIGYDAEALAGQMKEHQVTAVIVQGSEISFVQAAGMLLGWQVPRDLSVATLDREARILPRGLAVGGMLYDRYELGEQAARMMLRMLEEGEATVPSSRYVGEFHQGATISVPRSSQKGAKTRTRAAESRPGLT